MKSKKIFAEDVLLLQEYEEFRAEEDPDFSFVELEKQELNELINYEPRRENDDIRYINKQQR